MNGKGAWIAVASLLGWGIIQLVVMTWWAALLTERQDTHIASGGHVLALSKISALERQQDHTSFRLGSIDEKLIIIMDEISTVHHTPRGDER